MSLASKTPPPRDSWEDAVEEAAGFRDASPEEHYLALHAICRLVFDLLEKNPRRDELLSYRDPLSTESAALLETLRQGTKAP